jgi:hypothetical protein
MATIKINEIRFVGSDLLSDSESYLDELSDANTLEVTGGATPVISAATAVSALFVASLNFSYNAGRNYTR